MYVNNVNCKYIVAITQPPFQSLVSVREILKDNQSFSPAIVGN